MIRKELYWPVGISLVLLGFVGFLITFLLFSRTVPVNLVSENYYHDALNYQDQLDRIAQTKNLAEKPAWHYNIEAGYLEIEFPASANSGELKGTIAFLRPSDANRDIQMSLALDEYGKQRIATAELGKGLWKSQVHWDTPDGQYYQEEVWSIQ